MNNLVIRALRPDEADLFLSYAGEPTPGVGVEHRDYAEFLRTSQYRPEWSWVALRDERVVARAAYWGPPDATRPYSLDWLQVGTEPDRVAIGTELLKTADAELRTPEGVPAFHLFVPADWRDSGVRPEIDDRAAAAEGAGRELFVERLGFRFHQGDPLPPRPGRLRFEAGSDDAMIDAVRRGLPGTFDAESRKTIAESGDQAAAEQIVHEMATFPGPREWWRLAYDAAGDLVGMVMPSRNHAMAIIGYITVVADQRGRGYVDDLLAEATHALLAEGADIIGADTDYANVPMAAAFRRNGYRGHGGRLVMQ